MTLFVCLIDPAGQPITADCHRRYEGFPRSRGLTFTWRRFPGVSVLVVGDGPQHPPVVASHNGHLAAGVVRLDNRLDVARWAGCQPDDASDLELVLRAVSRHGAECVPRLHGDFAFVAWNSIARTGVAARDAFGLKKLYYTDDDGLLAFASRGDALALKGGYDMQRLAELVALCTPSPERSVYAGVHQVPGGTVAVVTGATRIALSRYWSPLDYRDAPMWRGSLEDAAHACRSLLADAVRLRLGTNGDTWAQLSGGLDSSSVVGLAQWLARSGVSPHGLAGTITYVDEHGTGADERYYSDAVIRKWRTRNETILGYPIWHDDRYDVPRIDEPNVAIMMYPRDYRLCEIVSGAHGKVLLTGVGGDNLFTGNMFFFADWLAHGHLLMVVREVARRAAMGHVSFWELAYRNALLPLLPRSIRDRLIRDVGQLPPWVSSTGVGKHAPHAQPGILAHYAGQPGDKYRTALVTGVAELVGGGSYDVIESVLDVRHPFLYRPLVEFALCLPPDMCARPNARKWILREAMRDILPDEVRTRVGKGGPYARLAYSISAQQSLLRPLVEEPILGDLGLIDVARFRAYFEGAAGAPQERQQLHASLHHTLAIEAWLQMRSGRWPHGGR